MEYRSKLLILLCLVVLSVAGCGADSNQKESDNYEIYTVKEEPSAINLYYQSVMRPIKTVPVVCPVDGNVGVLSFYYGQVAKKGDMLLVVISDSLQSNYRTALTNYLKSKDSYLTAVANFQGTQQLKNYGLIQEQQYLSDKSSVETDSLALMTSKYELEQALQYIPGVSFEEIDKLSLGDVREVEKILSKDYNRVSIRSPSGGIILFPEKSDDAAKQLTVGSQVKKDQTLLTLGDLSGLELNIKVGQRDVNRIKEGIEVTVTTPALPDLSLTGKVVAVGSQAEDSAGQSEFPVTVTVPSLSEENQKVVKVGMTAKVQITIDLPPVMQIPISAVTVDNGQSKVERLDPKTGKSEFVTVQTGRTTLNQVAIESGLKTGDKIFVRN